MDVAQSVWAVPHARFRQQVTSQVEDAACSQARSRPHVSPKAWGDVTAETRSLSRTQRAPHTCETTNRSNKKFEAWGAKEKRPMSSPKDVLLAQFQERTRVLNESVQSNKNRIASSHKRYSAQHGAKILTEPPRLHNTGVVSRTLIESQTPELFNNSNARTRAQAALFGGASTRTMICADVRTPMMYRTCAMDANEKVANGWKDEASSFKWVDREFTTSIYSSARWPIKNDPRQSSVGRFNVGIKH
jgi:hypothetical protein